MTGLACGFSSTSSRVPRNLDRPNLIDAAMTELARLPQPERSRVLANLDRAWAETSLGRPANALRILDTSLETGLFESADMRIHKYRLCLFKGEALLHLRCARPTHSNGWTAHMISSLRSKVPATLTSKRYSPGLNPAFRSNGPTACSLWTASKSQSMRPRK